MTTHTAAPDVQAGLPTVHLSLSRVGVTGVEKVIRLNHDGQEQLFWARMECVVDLGPRQTLEIAQRLRDDVLGAHAWI